MTDNTRVNELQDKLLKAMDILNAQALNSISFDKTIICKIENDKDKKEGKYEVSDGNTVFTAYSSDTKLQSGDVVYVTIPEGNFENQKMIIGKKTADNDKPFNFVQPFDTFFDMTGNLAGEIGEFGLVANDIMPEHKEETNGEYTKLEDCFTSTTILNINNNNENFPDDLINFPLLAVRADFRSWVKNAIKGNYGLLITLNTEKPNTTTGQMENGTYNYLFDSSMMYGNPYNFETYYSQEVVIDLEKQDIGLITGIRIDFYQNANFYDKFNEPIPSSENGFLKHEDGNYQRYGDKFGEEIGEGYYKILNTDTKLKANLFINNLELYFGKDISIFNSDIVEICTKNSLKFKTIQEKTIFSRWVHLKDGNPIDMIKKPDINVNYEIRWYKYILGSAAADEYCGVYWDRINPASGKRLFYRDNKWYEKELVAGVEQDKVIENLNTKSFTCKFTPDCKKNQEKIKCIILVNNNIPYRSNEILFENEQEVIDTSVQIFVNALQIKEDDNTNGNYMIYGQNNKLLDSEDTKIIRTLSAYFDANGDGEAESQIQPNDNLQWIFPNNSMVILQNGDPLLDNNGNEQKDEKGNTIRGNIVTKEQPQYKIASYYSPGKSNNTIQCNYINNGITYTTEKEFTFGPSGTMGTDQTIVIDFVGDTKALQVGTETFQMQVQVYNNKNELLIDVPENITWSWLYPIENSYLRIPDKEKDTDGNEKSHPSIIDITVDKQNFNIDQLYILQVQVGDLITYFPIPIKTSEDYSYITGATQVIYQSDGEPNYSKEIYTLCDSSGNKRTGIKWRIKHLIPDDKLDKEKKFIGTIKSYNNGQVLEPLSLYVKDAPVYGVQALDSSDNILWTQPILVLQNKWPSNVINKWDGKSLVLDEENSMVIAAAVSAGRKNLDNTFSGVMIGDWSGKDLDTNSSIANQTGVYGFHHGAMSYAFKEDGTAFIGKYGDGRINFNGNNSTIYSANYAFDMGMMIDLGGDNTPYIDMKNGSNKYVKLGFTTTSSNPYLEIKSTNNIIRFNSTDEGSKIQLKNEDNAITISSASNENPLAIGSKFHVKWDGSIESTSGQIGGWTITATELNNGTLSLNSSTSTITGGTLKAANGTMNLDGRLAVRSQDSISGGYLGYIEADYGDKDTTSNDEESDNSIDNKEKSPGIGLAYGTQSVIKATATNAGLSCAGYYLSLQKVSNNPKAVLRHVDNRYGRLVMDNNHIGIGFNAATSGGGAFITVGEKVARGHPEWGNKPYTNTITIKADAIRFDLDAENQHGIYARFA